MDPIDRLAAKLAAMHKANVNPPSTAPQVAEVVGVSPLRLKWGNDIILDYQKLHIPRKFTDGIPQEGGPVYKIELAAGDKVIIIPDADYKMFYLMDLL